MFLNLLTLVFVCVFNSLMAAQFSDWHMNGVAALLLIPVAVCTTAVIANFND